MSASFEWQWWIYWFNVPTIFLTTMVTLSTVRSMLRSLGTPSQQQYEVMWTTSLNPRPLGEEFARTWNSCPPRKRMCHGKNTLTCHFRAFPYVKLATQGQNGAMCRTQTETHSFKIIPAETNQMKVVIKWNISSLGLERLLVSLLSTYIELICIV